MSDFFFKIRKRVNYINAPRNKSQILAGEMNAPGTSENNG